jgi:SAM-dependent methyltransferase
MVQTAREEADPLTEPRGTLPTVASAVTFQQERRAHWDAVAGRFKGGSVGGRFYQAELAHRYRLLVPPGMRILEVGCGQGDLLAALSPSVGVGVDFSASMLKQASEKHPHLQFIHADAQDLDLAGPFDVIVLSDLVNDLWDVQAVLEKLANVMGPQTRLILNTYSRVWQLPVFAAQRLGLSRPTLAQNWLTVEDIANLLDLTGFAVVKQSREILLPVRIPLVTRVLNRIVAKLWPVSMLALTNFLVARRSANSVTEPPEHAPRVSVIVPARNEAGNIEGIMTRTPEMGSGTELIFVEGHSQDNTYDTIVEAMSRHPERRARLLRQTGRGKGDAVRLGFSEATGDVLMILDADLTVLPEHLPRFFEAVVTGRGEFVNGVRLIYPMEGQAMRFFNLVGNKFFSLAFTWLLGQSVKDTLCGTKVLRKTDYDRIAANRGHFGEFDPFGDFDLLFGANRLSLKIVDLPVRYHQRTYGSTNIQRWRHGWLLLRMVAFAAMRIKFV